MTLSLEEVIKVAHLARLSMSETEQQLYASQLSHIIEFVKQMDQADTSNVAPMSHPEDEAYQPLRVDKVTAHNQRQIFQKIAPSVKAGLYIVPKVIE